VYTGDGKGKTTAAMGLALRAAGCGLSVKVVQFLKGRDSGEIRRISAGGKFFCAMNEMEKTQLRRDVTALLPVIENWLGHADVLVLDEALGALHCGVLKMDEVLSIIECRGGTEVILTGRNAPEEIVKRAHLVTEMREVKHYMNDGVPARKGIEF
jgi:cob(I)alamin adenosyltransferase